MTTDSSKRTPKTRTYRQTRVKDKQADPSFVEQARRKQILDAALELFSQKGYQKTSLADIASVLKISKGVISYHFDGKEELGEQVLRHSLDKYEQFIQQRLSSHDTSRSKLLGFPGTCLEYVKAHEPDYQVYIDALGSFATLDDRRAFMAEQDSGLRRFLVGLIREMEAEEGIVCESPEVLADLLQAVVDGLMEMYSADSKNIDLDACELMFRNMISLHLAG